jgi:hypothetical protein
MSLQVYNSRERRRDLIPEEALVGAVVEETCDDGDGALVLLALRLKDGRKVILTGSSQIGVDSIFLKWDKGPR